VAEIINPLDLSGAMTELGTSVGRVVQVKETKLLIKKKNGEKLSDMYKRAEGSGIARQCIQCGGKRRYAITQCPYCGSYGFVDVKGQPSEPPAALLPNDEEEVVNLDTPEVNDGYAFEPIDPGSERAKEKAEQHAAKFKQLDQTVQSHQQFSFQEMDLTELQDFAKGRDIPLGRSRNRKDIIAKIEEYVGGFKADPTPEQMANATTLSTESDG
jgi:hypothetical protein